MSFVIYTNTSLAPNVNQADFAVFDLKPLSHWTVYCLLFTVYCFCREMRSPGGSCFPLCNLLKNSVTSGVILKVNMSLFGCKLFSICVNRSQKCRNVHSQGVYLIMS